MERISQIRHMAGSDVDAILAMQAASPEAAAWNRQAYEMILAGSNINRCLVAMREDKPAGFACFRVIGGEAELLNLAVLPELRRQGIAAQLLEAVIREAAGNGAADLFLEVRDSNLAALALYKQFGFQLNHRRPGYYRNPPADALTMHLRFPASKPIQLA